MQDTEYRVCPTDLYDEDLLDNVIEKLIEKYKETKRKEILNEIDILFDLHCLAGLL